MDNSIVFILISNKTKKDEKFKFDRLYKNMLELIKERQKQYPNSTFCNLNDCYNFFILILAVIVHYVIGFIKKNPSDVIVK